MNASTNVVGRAGLGAAEPLAPRSRRRISPSLIAGVAILGVVLVAVIVGPMISPYDPTEPVLTETFAGPSMRHPLGTDNFGRDILTRILYGGRVDLMIAFLATSVTVVVGGILGAIAGFYGKWWDTIIMRIVDIAIAFPFLVLVIAIVAMLGPSQNNIFVAIWLVGWIAYARIVRGEILVVKRLEYVEAARVVGLTDRAIILRHIAPNVITPVVVFAMADMVLNILVAASLSFLGLGTQPPNPEWGLMIAEGRDFFLRSWQLTTIPGLAILVVGTGFSLLGDGLADLLRPAR
ncbi:ABC transporter permease [Sphaerobacter sp.]|uniref:ABC transporter permease n=1 Tax=Sphaerobacter sp. TaxID=2099654 RepID=UPI001DD5A346|nr:ABC transporter permease [Sphaerobacter sp.]MBX5444201.1 ABC transporter permease [Sphaerobacter sp.]